MKRSSREKIALVVFMLLAIGGLIGLGWYIVAGHSWNVAASTIDDTVGEMEGYTAIIYPGTTEPLEKDDAAARGSEPRTSLLSPLGREDPEPVDLEALVAEYEEKGAEVVFLDEGDLNRYEEGAILKRGGKRIGVVSAGEGVTQLDLSRVLRSFERSDVDFTVVLTTSEWKLGRVSGIDIAICLEDEDIVAMGETRDATFYVGSPKVGETGVVLVSPSNVVSAKVVSGS